LEDLLNKIEMEMRQKSHSENIGNEHFIPWCMRHPEVLLAALLISFGMVVICK
jgi:hypothetical protein